MISVLRRTLEMQSFLNKHLLLNLSTDCCFLKLCYYVSYVNLMITAKSSSDNCIHFLINCTIILQQESKNALLDHIGP